MVNGILNVNKPAGWTSHDVVGFMRRRLGVKRVGHAGTLDPFATGVLLVCVGRATRVAEYLAGSRKSYRAVAELGLTTDTYDVDGAVVSRAAVPNISAADVEAALARFVGAIEQTPPAYSAIKQQGVPAYRRARRGEQVVLPPRQVHIHAIRLLSWQSPRIEFEVTCDPGTYIRSLAYDVGQVLGCGATLMELIRTSSGPFRVEDASSPDQLVQAASQSGLSAYLHPLRSALSGLTPVAVGPTEIERLAHGQAIAGIAAPHNTPGYALAADEDVVAILRYDEDRQAWQPTKVLIAPDEG
jgi:tRNA pseudouridine55 synthase